MTIPDHELPGWLVVIIIILAALCLLLAGAYLGYVPSPLSSKLEAHDTRAVRTERAGLAACGAMMEMVGRQPMRCFDDDDARNIFVGTR